MKTRLSAAVTMMALAVWLGACGADNAVNYQNGEDASANEEDVSRNAETQNEATQNNADALQNDDEIAQTYTLAPSLTIFDSDGAAVSLEDFRGKPTLLNFWASWCPDCAGEMPIFESVYLEKGGDFNFVMLDLINSENNKETREKAESYIAENGFTFPVYFDMSESAVDIYGLTNIPTSVFIDERGRVIRRVDKEISEDTLRRYLNDALSEGAE
ncbi:MAG: TlpA family protein disulfide reductase [Clostridiales bacterium]|nr:TlpA family protein disulfide reductase [Clostridiales bacterium]